MAVLGRLLVSSAERLDLPDFLSIDSYTQGDFKYLLKSFVGDDKPFILKGFDVINPGNTIGTQNISVRVADSVVYYPGSLAGPYFHGLPEGNSQSAPLVPELRKNATNYVYLTLTTTEAAKDTRAFWDPDKEGGDGGEFTQDVNTQTVLSVDINVSVSSFPENTVPICKVVVGANFIDSIEDARDMMFRLGSGGLNPNPLDRYDWREDPSSAYSRSEPNTLMSSALDPNPFEGGDKNIQSLKEWMDAIMTKLAELGGTTYWYEDTSVFNLINVFKDALTTSIKSKGYWNSSDVTPGTLTWSEDINVQQTSDLSELIIRAGSKTLADNEVLYIDRVRDIGINTGGVAVEWFNAVNHVNGQLGSFESLSKGDWVKKADDNDNLYLRVEEFYAAANKGGGVTAAGSALSIKLSAPYAGISESKQASFIKGVYLASEVSVADRAAQEIQDAAGNFYWLAMRSDTILDISDLTTTTLALDIENHDGVRAKVTSVTHGLSDGQRITIAGSTNFDGTYACSVEDADVFYIDLVAGPNADELTQSGFYATVTTAARSTDDGLQLESANHGLSTDQKVIISDTTNYNGDYQVFPTGNTSYTIPVGSAIVNETVGINTGVNIYVRTDIGPTKLERGESKAIGEVETANLMSFIGMDNDAQTHPNYHVAPDYNTLDGKENFNSELTDNLTHRVSKLTSMMADRAQDKAVVQSAAGITSYSNITSGGDQLVSFIPGGTFTALQPGSPGNATISLGGTLTLATNQVATYIIDRNASSNIADLTGLTIYDIDDCPIEENLFIFAYRFANTTVHLWDGEVLLTGSSIVLPVLRGYVQQNKTVKLVKGGTWSWDLNTDTLTNNASGFIQVGGLAENVNEVAAQSIVLDADGKCAYVTLKRNAGASVLAVSVADIASVPQDDHTLIIARRTGTNVVVGGSTTLTDNESANLYSTNSNFENQDNNKKLIEGGTWSFIENGGNTNPLVLSQLNDTISGVEFGQSSTNLKYAQTFTVPGVDDFTLNNLTFNLSDASSSSGTLQYKIYAESGGIPTGPELATTAPIPVSSVVAGYTTAPLQVSLITPVVLTAGVKYIMVLDGTNVVGRLRTDQANIDAIPFHGIARFSNITSLWDFISSDLFYILEGTVSAPATSELVLSADAYVQIPQLDNVDNTIDAQTITMNNITDVAYVDIHRESGGASLPVTVANINTLDTNNEDLVIIARRTSTGVVVGASFNLKDGEFLELDGALAEINRYHGQLAVTPNTGARVAISGSDIAKLSGSQLSLEQKNLLLAFEGAIIDFETGEVFESDGVTPFLGGANDFTPFVIGANEYFYYSVSVLPNTANADNTISGQILVIPATASNAALVSAPKAPFPGSGLKLANIYVQEDGAAGILDIGYSNIIQLGVGGGSGGSGNANADLTRYQDRLNLAPFDFANTNIAEINESDQLDGTSTATFDIPTGSFKFADSTAQVLQSLQQLDSEFLLPVDENDNPLDPIDITTVELYSIWNLDSVDSAATYEVTRDGVNWQTVSAGRIGKSDAYRALHAFTDEPSNAFNQEYAVSEATDVKDFDDASVKEISQKFTVADTTVFKNVILYVNKATASATGRFCVEIVKDDSGAPSQDPNDVVWTSPSQNIDDLAIGNNVVDISGQFVVRGDTADYHIITKPDDAYRNAYTSNNADKISWRMDNTSGPVPNLRTYNGSTWSAEVADETAVYRLEGRVLDVRVRITSSATADDKFLSSYGLFYQYENGIEYSKPVFRELFEFDGTVDNDNEFILTNFLPDSRLLMCFALGTGQTFRYGDFVLDGHKVVFPPNTFNVVGDVKLEFFQMQAVDSVASSAHDALLTANALGSTDASIDKSIAGHGIFLRRPDGTLREITIDDTDSIVIYSV